MATIYVSVPSNELLQAIDVFLHFGYNINSGSILVNHNRFNQTCNCILAVNTSDNKVTYKTSTESFPGFTTIPLTNFFILIPDALEILKPMRFRFITPDSRIPLSAHPHAVFTVHNSLGVTYHSGDEQTEAYVKLEHIRVLASAVQFLTVEEQNSMVPWYVTKLLGSNTVAFFNNYVGHRQFFTMPDLSSQSFSVSVNTNIEVNADYIPDEYGNFMYKFPSITKYFYKDYLKDQIRTRYGFFDRPSSGLSNVIMDSFFPRLISYYNFNIHHMHKKETFPRTACAISPLIAEVLNVKKVRTEQLCRVLGYTSQTIKNLLGQVRAKNLNIVFAGTGGTGINTLYWLTELCEMTHSINLFSTITLYESEDIEYSNIFRFPVSLAAYSALTRNGNASKLLLAEPLAEKLSTKVQTYKCYLTKRDTSNPFGLFSRYYPSDAPSYAVTSPNTVIYGAPSLSARDELSSLGRFIAATHANTSCSLWLNPKQEQDIQVESYGMIQLGGFFMNQLRMTIAFLEVLASDQDLTELDKQLFKFEFDGTHKLTADRNYNWQINRDMLMMTAEQATTL